ncbi:hypothetical protein V2G26_007348 [Clonostachys chloroleuca]
MLDGGGSSLKLSRGVPIIGTSRSPCCPQNLSSPNLLSRQGPHESIYISSDDGGTFDADEGASSNGYQDIDDSRSDDTLTTVDTIIASIKKSSPVFFLSSDLSMTMPTSHRYLIRVLVGQARGMQQVQTQYPLAHRQGTT